MHQIINSEQFLLGKSRIIETQTKYIANYALTEIKNLLSDEPNNSISFNFLDILFNELRFYKETKSSNSEKYLQQRILKMRRVVK